MNKTPFIKFHKTKEVTELMRKPNCFMLLVLIVQRAKRTNEFNIDNLKCGEALIGDYKSIGQTEQQYKTAKRNLQKWGFATFKGTNKGTIATIVNTRIFDINIDLDNEPTNEPATNQLTNQQRTSNERVTTNKNEKKDKKDKKENNLNENEDEKYEKEFEEFWKSYIPIKTPKGGQKEALKSFIKQRQENSFDKIKKGSEMYLAECNGVIYTKSVTNFLDDEIFNNYDIAINQDEEKEEEKRKREQRIKELTTINNDDPFFIQLQRKLNFMGTSAEKLNYCFKTNTAVFFITETKFQRDWIRKEFQGKLENILEGLNLIVHSKEEFCSYK